MERIYIQIQSEDGNWQTYVTTENQPPVITNEMQELKRRYPEKRVRAIDESGRLVDFLA